MAHCFDGRIRLSVTWLGSYIHQRNPDTCASTPSRYLGECFRDHGNSSGCDTICASNLDDISAWACGQFEYPNDAHSDPWKLCLVCKFGCEIRYRRLEYMGSILGDRMLAGLSVGNGYMLRGQGPPGATKCGRRTCKFSFPLSQSSLNSI